MQRPPRERRTNPTTPIVLALIAVLALLAGGLLVASTVAADERTAPAAEHTAPAAEHAAPAAEHAAPAAALDEHTAGADDESAAETNGTPLAENASGFAAVGQRNGTIVLDENHDDPIEIPECDGDEPLPEDAPANVEWEEACFEIDAEIDGDEWSADAENVTIPEITDTNPPSLASEAAVQLTAPDGLSGTIDPETGEVTLEGTLAITADISAPLGQGDVCETEAELEATTGESGSLEGEPLNGSEPGPSADDAGDDGTGDTDDENVTTATLVDNEFEVPAFSEGSLACNGANDAYGLPSDEGDSYFELEYRFAFEE